MAIKGSLSSFYQGGGGDEPADTPFSGFSTRLKQRRAEELKVAKVQPKKAIQPQKPTQPQFDLNRGLEALKRAPGEFVKGVTDVLTQPAINAIGTTLEQERLAQEVRKQGGGVDKKILQQLRASNERDFKAGVIPKAQYERSNKKVEQQIKKVSTAETEAGVTQDREGAALAALEIASAPIGVVKAPVTSVTKLGTAFRTARAEAKNVAETRRVDNALTKVDDSQLSDFAQKQIKQAIEVKGKYKQPVLNKAIDTAKRELADPLNKFERLDRAYAKKTGVPLEKLQAQGRSLPEQVLNARYSDEIVKTFLEKKRTTGTSVNDIVRKYGEDTPAGREFVNYVNNKRTIEVLDKYKKNIQPGQNIDDIRAAVKAYEDSNTGVGTDLRTLKEHFDEILDYAADNKLITKQDAKFIQKRYDTYAPIERAFPDERIKPSVQGGVRTNVGRQRVIQELEGGQQPLDVSFGAIINKTNDAITQSLKNRLDNELLTRFKEGNLSGKLLLDPSTSAAAKVARATHKELVAKTESLRKKMGTRAGQLRVDNAYTAPLRKRAISSTKKYLRGSTDDHDALAAIDKMTSNELLNTFRFINDDVEIDSLRASLIKKGAPGQRLLDDLENLKTEYKDLSGQKSEAFEESLTLRQDPATGLNKVSGVVDGNKFELELAPDVMTALERLSPSDKRAAFGTLASLPSNIQKTLFTGPFAPVFQATQLLKNQGIMFTNSKNLSPFGARAIASFFKPSKQFTDELRLRGAMPELFTQSVNEGTQQAAQIASRGSLKGTINLAKNHPILATKDFWKSLNRFGAFLGNRQRTQIATGAYHNAIRRGFDKEEALNIAARSYNEVLGNFNRVSNLAKAAEPVFLYSGATQAGARSLFRAFRDRPIETSLKMTAVATPMAGFAANNLSSQAGQDYYQDMYDNKQAYNLDNYLTYVAPWAEKDPKTKKWSGVYRLPIVPDFRPINKSIQEQIYNSSKSEGVNATEVAKAAFNFATGGTFAATGGRTDVSPQELIQGIPALRATFSLAGRDIETGKVIPDEDTAYTSETAKKIGEKFGLPANRVDALLKQGGMAGRVTQGRSSPTDTLQQTFTGQFTGPYGSSKGISGKIDSLISDRSKVASDLKKAREDQDPVRIAELQEAYNAKVDEFERFVLENKRIRNLSEGQQGLLDKLRF